MKSLQESLFDKDLVIKGLTVGDYYEPESFGFENSNIPLLNNWSYEDILGFIDASKLKKDYKPADLSNTTPGGWIVRSSNLNYKYSDIKDFTIVKTLEYVIAFINACPCPSYELKTGDLIRLNTYMTKQIQKYLKSPRIRIETIYRHDGLTFRIRGTKANERDNDMWVVYKKK